MRETHRDVYSFLSEFSPETPVHVLYSDVLAETAATAVSVFPGDVLYAVKCNDHPLVLRALYEGGVRHFDTASLTEIEMIRGMFPDAVCHFMHPVKPAHAIAAAYRVHGVKAFALDHIDELEKIVAAVGANDTADTTLVVRVEMPRGQATMDLTGKFGAPIEEAAELLTEIHRRGFRTGLTFHVGSYCTNPKAYRQALEICRRVQSLANVPLDVLDVGGGFPAIYTGTEGDFRDYVDEIEAAFADLAFEGDVALRCEPGRGLVAVGQSMLVRVDLRRRNDLFLNDGVFGGLSELKYLGPVFPIQVLRPDGFGSADVVEGDRSGFQFFGPTCDSVDSSPGPFYIPTEVKTGDWLEIGKMGAYSNAYRTRFNGFHSDLYVEVDGRPFWEGGAGSDSKEGKVSEAA